METENHWDFDVHSQDSLAHPNHLEPHSADLGIASHQDLTHPLPGIGHDDGLRMGHADPLHFGRGYGHVPGNPEPLISVVTTESELEKLQNGPEADKFSLAMRQPDGQEVLLRLDEVDLSKHHQRKD